MGVILITTGLVEDEQVRSRRCPRWKHLFNNFCAPFAGTSVPTLRATASSFLVPPTRALSTPAMLALTLQIPHIPLSLAERNRGARERVGCVREPHLRPER